MKKLLITLLLLWAVPGWGASISGVTMTGTSLMDADLISYDLNVPFTAGDQTFSNEQVLDTAAEGVTTGSLTVVDTSTGTVKIVGNELELVGANGNTTGIKSTSVTRTQGKAMLWTFEANSASTYASKMGFSKTDSVPLSSNTNSEHILSFALSSNLYLYDNTFYPIIGSYAADTSYQIAIVLGNKIEDDETGASYFIKGGIYTNWTLLWESILESTTPLYPGNTSYSSGTISLFDNLLIPTNVLTPSIMFQPNFLDTFTGTNDDQLVSAHTPEVVAGATGSGNPWESGSTTWTIQGNAASNDPGLEASLWDADAAVFTSGTYSWVVYGTNTIANDANTLKITYVDDPSGARVFLRDSNDLSSDLTIGKIYKFKSDNKVNAGSSIDLLIYDKVTFNTYATITDTSFVTSQAFISAKNISLCEVRISGFGVGEEAWVDNLSLQEITINEIFATDDLSINQGLFDVNVTIPATTNGMAGLVLALDSESSPANFIQAYYNRGTGKVEIWKCVAGTYTNLINTTATYAAGAQLRAIVDYIDNGEGDDDLKLKVYYNNALIGTEQTITDDGIAGNTQHGIMSVDSANTLDNFTVHYRTNSAWDAEISAATGSIY